ncbi:hypothetical protein Tco_1296905 [Tanacetum coccineum]
MHSYDNISRRLKSASTKFAPDHLDGNLRKYTLLGLILRTNGQDYNSTRKSVKNVHIVRGDDVAISSDGVKTLKRRRQKELVMASALGWHFEEIHVTWAHLKKKRTRLQLYIQVDEDLCSQSVETESEKHVMPSGLHGDGVRIICDGVRIITDLKKP